MGERTAMVPATEAGACSACPWRTTNQGRRHPDGWYTKANLRRLWAGMRRGESMTCHPTDPANPVPTGVRPVPSRTKTRECYGVLVLIQRELQRVAEAIEASPADGFRCYRAENPHGLTREGAAAHLWNAQVGSAPFVGRGLAMTRVDLNDASVSYAELVPWAAR